MLQVMYTVVEDAPVYHSNMRMHQRLFNVLLKYVRARRAAVRRKEAALRQQYLTLFEQWRQHMAGECAVERGTLVSTHSRAPALLGGDVTCCIHYGDVRSAFQNGGCHLQYRMSHFT